MAALNKIAREYADEIRDGIAWVIVWKEGRSWDATAVWLDPDTDTFEPEDLELARKILEKDPKAVMVNGYCCGHFSEDMTPEDFELMHQHMEATRQEAKKRDPIPRQHFRRKFCWTADKVYAQIQEARQQRRLYPCEHCQWRMDGAKDIVCLGYCELWGTQDKKAPARSCTSDRRTAPNEAASELPLS